MATRDRLDKAGYKHCEEMSEALASAGREAFDGKQDPECPAYNHEKSGSTRDFNYATNDERGKDPEYAQSAGATSTNEDEEDDEYGEE